MLAAGAGGDEVSVSIKHHLGVTIGHDDGACHRFMTLDKLSFMFMQPSSTR